MIETMDAWPAGPRCVQLRMVRFDPMGLKLYDTLTREKRVFEPLDPGNVRMYVCGPTVYDFAHIGNARPVIVFDVLFRLLRHLYGADHVTYVRNITDVDDKINARAAEEYPDLPLNEAIRKVTEKTDRQFHEDVAALGCLPPTVEPRATEHIAEMRTLIERLVKSGNAYVAADNVLFSVPSDPDYGELSKRPLDEMIAGARVEVAPYKREPMDFVLWKPSKPDNTTPLWFWAEDWAFVPSEPYKPADAKPTPLWFWETDLVFVLWDPSTSREPAWVPPYGTSVPGRPGWHIECSAMSWRYLGEIFDIHGGGIDLVFPHHENEIAQSRCAFHTPVMANFWLHNGFLQVEGEKMAKSEGNFVTIREALRSRNGEAIRLNMLMTHYRQPINWTNERLREAEVKIDNWYRAIPDNVQGSAPDPAIEAALADDLNTWMAIQRLEELYHALKREPYASIDKKLEKLETFKASANLLGLMHRDFKSWHHELNVRQTEFELTRDDLLREHVDACVEARNEARRAKNFREADRIRDELAKMGVVLKDTKDGTTWEIAR